MNDIEIEMTLDRAKEIARNQLPSWEGGFALKVVNAIEELQCRCICTVEEFTPVKILMSADNPDGYKLEDLLATLRKEVIEKNNKINNEFIIQLLCKAEKTQRNSYDFLAQKAPDQGPSGTPRIGNMEIEENNNDQAR